MDTDRRRPPRLTLLREVKVDSPVHRLTTETKFVAVAGISITLSFFPSWGGIAIAAALLVGATFMAHVPAGALPRPPAWFWVLLIVTGGFATTSGGSPHVRLGSVAFGLGGADAYCKFVLVGVVLLYGAMVIGWTTSLADVAPAMRRLFAPFRLVRLPVEEWSVAVALCVRSFPLMLNEIRILVAARRLRPAPSLGADQASVQGLVGEAVDVMVAVLAVSVRRAAELADAIAARGGTGLITARRRPFGAADVVALTAVGLACAVISQIPVP